MKKICLLLITMILLFSACQPTPEELVVRSKADDSLDDLIQQTAQPQETAAPYGHDGEEVTDEPTYTITSFDYSFKSKDEDVNINVNAEVSMLDGAQYQVALITHQDFSIEFVERACEVLLEGQEMFEPRNGQTKDEIEAEILELQAALANPEESHSDGLNSGDPDIIAEVTEMFLNRIEIYKDLLEDAPDTIERIPVTFQYMPKKYYTNEAYYQESLARYSDETDDEQAMEILDKYENEMQLIVDADLSNDYYGRVEVENYSSKWLNSGVFRFYKSTELNLATYGPSMTGTEYSEEDDEFQMSEEEAINYANGILDDMGIEGMTLSNVYANTSDARYFDDVTGEYVVIPEEERTIFGYGFTYVRTYGSLPVMESSIYYAEAEPEYGPRYTNESFYITIDKYGVVNLSWKNQPQIVEVENDNVAILPLDEIMEIFNKQMAIEYNVIGLFDYDESESDYKELLESITDARIDVTSISLKMIRLPVKNQTGIYRMIPVWVFKGTSFFYREGGRTYEEVSEVLEEKCFLLINAVDGTIID